METKNKEEETGRLITIYISIRETPQLIMKLRYLRTSIQMTM